MSSGRLFLRYSKQTASWICFTKNVSRSSARWNEYTESPYRVACFDRHLLQLQPPLLALRQLLLLALPPGPLLALPPGPLLALLAQPPPPPPPPLYPVQLWAQQPQHKPVARACAFTTQIAILVTGAIKRRRAAQGLVTGSRCNQFHPCLIVLVLSNAYKNDGFSLKVLFGTYLDFSTGCWVLLGLRAMVCSTPRLPLAILFTKWRDLHQQEILFGVRQILRVFMSQIFGCFLLSTQPPTFIGDDLTKDSWFMTQSSYYFAMGWIASCWSNGDFDLWGFFFLRNLGTTSRSQKCTSHVFFLKNRFVSPKNERVFIFEMMFKWCETA